MPTVGVLLGVFAAAGCRGAAAGATDPADAPALDAPDEDYAVFSESLMATYRDILANVNWEDLGAEDGVSAARLSEPSQGCPWVRAAAELSNCSLGQSARFIMTELPEFQALWDSTYVPQEPFRTIDLPNGTRELAWHVEKDSAFLGKRVYYQYSSWQWSDAGSIETISNSVHPDLAAPAGASGGVRSTQWMWRRLTATGPATTRYEVLYLSDLKGSVPCALTVGGQVGSIRDEVSSFRHLIPQMSPPEAALEV